MPRARRHEPRAVTLIASIGSRLSGLRQGGAALGMKPVRMGHRGLQRLGEFWRPLRSARSSNKEEPTPPQKTSDIQVTF